jgi:hypothetical protein
MSSYGVNGNGELVETFADLDEKEDYGSAWIDQESGLVNFTVGCNTTITLPLEEFEAFTNWIEKVRERLDVLNI